jgi:hypothetical protein
MITDADCDWTESLTKIGPIEIDCDCVEPFTELGRVVMEFDRDWVVPLIEPGLCRVEERLEPEFIACDSIANESEIRIIIACLQFLIQHSTIPILYY